MTQSSFSWTPGQAVRVGSREHYGWEETEYVVVGLHPGTVVRAEFLQVRRGPSEELSLFLRQRFGTADWSSAEASEIPVAGWYGEQVPDGAIFAPATPNPDAWLYVVPPHVAGGRVPTDREPAHPRESRPPSGLGGHPTRPPHAVRERVSSEMDEIVAGILERVGLPPHAVVLADAAPDAQPPPEGPWAIVRAGGEWVVGGMGRGRFVPYEGRGKVSDALDLAVRLAAAPLPLRETDPSAGEVEQGRATGAAILERTAARGGSAGSTALQRGELLDLIGPETGHHLYALGTPFPARSQPPSDVGAPYLTFRVVQALPPTVQEGRAAPWFEQPGGGAMVVLDRPIRWYVDRGYLAPISQP